MIITKHAYERWRERIGPATDEEIALAVVDAKPAGRRLLRQMREVFPNSHEHRVAVGNDVYVVGDAILIVKPISAEHQLDARVLTVLSRKDFRQYLLTLRSGNDSLAKRRQRRGYANNRHKGRERGTGKLPRNPKKPR